MNQKTKFYSSSDISNLFSITTITAGKWMKKWVNNGICKGGYDEGGRFRIFAEDKIDILLFSSKRKNTSKPILPSNNTETEEHYSTLFEFRGHRDFNEDKRFKVSKLAKEQKKKIKLKRINSNLTVNSYPTKFLISLQSQGIL